MFIEEKIKETKTIHLKRFPPLLNIIIKHKMNIDWKEIIFEHAKKKERTSEYGSLWNSRLSSEQGEGGSFLLPFYLNCLCVITLFHSMTNRTKKPNEPQPPKLDTRYLLTDGTETFKGEHNP